MSVTSFPNAATQFVPGVSGNPGGKLRGGRVARRKARQLQEATVLAKIISQDTAPFAAPFEGDGLDLLVATYQNPQIPLAIRLACATQAAQYERSKRATTDAAGGTAADALARMTPDERLDRARALIARAQQLATDVDAGPQIEVPAVVPEADTREAELKASIAKAEAERDQLRAEAARREAEQKAADRAQQDRLRLCGRDYVPYGRVR